MSPTLRLLRELVALPSVNPAFTPANDPWSGEQRVVDFLAATAAKVGLDVELQPVFAGRSNLIARLSPSGRARRRIVLAPHLDTVGAIDCSDGLFVPKVVHGRLHGRGACDTKGSVAAMFAAVASLVRERRRPTATEVIFAGLVDEENAQAGSRAFAKRGVQADLAIVGEPTRLQVVTAHKGDLWLQLETRGKAAHGATPQLGRNAVHSMARIVDLLETCYARDLRRRRHPLLGCPTINVGAIAGGTQPNIVPSRCRISIDRRTLPGESEAAVRQELRQLLAPRGLSARMVDLRAAPCPPLETDPDLPLVRQLMQCARQKAPVGVHFFCDAAVLAGGGLPSVVFGPGDIAQAHTSDEWISVRSLETAQQILVRFLQSLP